MYYTIRGFVKGRDPQVDEICRIFCSMERSAYNLLREGEGRKAGSVKGVLRGRYGVTNARWIQSALNQAKAVTASQEEGIAYRIEMYEQKVENTMEKLKHLSNPMKVQGCVRKVAKVQARLHELKAQLVDRSYPKAIFGSRKLHHQLSTARGDRRKEVGAKWRERRSNHFFSVGEANQKGNANTRLLCSVDDGGVVRFHLEIRNWPGGDFSLDLHVPGVYTGLVRAVIGKAESFKLGKGWRPLEGYEGLPYSVMAIRSKYGYQALVSFELEEPSVPWSGRVAGIDINPEGIGCAIISDEGNLVATRFFRERRFVTASRNKRKWFLEDTVNRMLRWCRDTHGCNAVALEDLKFKGAYDFSARTNFKLSNFMKRKMLQRVRLSALKMGMLSVDVDPAYSSRVAVAKYGKRFGGFNRHQLAAFVIARRVLGYGEAPVLDCLPMRKERAMWNRCVKYYGCFPLVQTLPRHEPVEWKSAVVDVNGGGGVTELLRAPPATTPSQMGSSRSPPEGVMTSEIIGRRAGRVRPNGHASRGDGARGRRVSPPGVDGRRSAVIFDVREDNENC